jgi:hypothetical protein
VKTYLVVRIYLPPIVLLRLSRIHSNVVPSDLKVLTNRLPPFLSTLDHSAQGAIQTSDKLAPDHLQQLVAGGYYDIHSCLARCLNVHCLLQVVQQETLHGHEALW